MVPYHVPWQFEERQREETHLSTHSVSIYPAEQDSTGRVSGALIRYFLILRDMVISSSSSGIARMVNNASLFTWPGHSRCMPSNQILRRTIRTKAKIGEARRKRRRDTS